MKTLIGITGALLVVSITLTCLSLLARFVNPSRDAENEAALEVIYDLTRIAWKLFERFTLITLFTHFFLP